MESVRKDSVQQGRGYFDLEASTPFWNKAAHPQKRRLVVQKICQQEKAARHTKATALAK